MTKDIPKKNFRFKSERQRSIVFSFIRELKQTNMLKKQIAETVKKQYNLTAHTRTIEGWIKLQPCIFSDNWIREQKLMNKWHEEYAEPKISKTNAEIQLEEMYGLAQEQGCLITHDIKGLSLN